MDGKKELIEEIQWFGKHYLKLINPVNPIDRNIAKHLIQFSLDTTLNDELQELQILTDLRTLISRDDIDGELMHGIGLIINNYEPFEHITWDNKNPPTIPQILDLMIADAKKNIKPELFEEALKSPRAKSFDAFGGRAILMNDNASGAFSHITQVVHKTGDDPDANKTQSVWYAKQCANKLIALREVVAQEFFRLIMSYQPKTRIAKEKSGDTYVVSKGREGTESLERIPFEQNKKAFGEDYGKSDGYKGLGGVLVIMLLLNEIDAKLGNLLVDRQGRIIKIDGDYCFSKLNESDGHIRANSDITPDDFSALPFVSDYSSFNWLDLFQGGKLNVKYKADDHDNTIFGQSLINNPIFRQEINAATLKVLVMPNELLKTFFSSYTHSQSEAALLTNELQHRMGQLRQAALENPNFLNYMKTNAAQENLNQIVAEFKDFKTMKKNHLINEMNGESLISKIKNKFTGISTGIKNVYSGTDNKIKEFLTQKSTRAASLPSIKTSSPKYSAEEKIEEKVNNAKQEKIIKPLTKKNTVLPVVEKTRQRDIASIVREAMENSDGFSNDDQFFNQQKARTELPPLTPRRMKR